MEVLQALFDHFWLIIIFLFLFGGSISGAIKWTIRRSLKHRESMQELKNEELRLQLEIAQMRKKASTSPVPPAPAPKEVAWEEREAFRYETGYQQQQQQIH